jgi:DNA-dependent protein kinase catalytic subunit
MPFRLTKVFQGLTKPVGLNGIFRHSMVAALSCLKAKRHVLMDFCEIFINDPLLDMLKIARDKNVSQDFLS